jgi:hypothetical protein
MKQPAKLAIEFLGGDLRVDHTGLVRIGLRTLRDDARRALASRTSLNSASSRSRSAPVGNTSLIHTSFAPSIEATQNVQRSPAATGEAPTSAGKDSAIDSCPATAVSNLILDL